MELCSIIILLLGLLDSLGTKYLYDEVIFSRLEQTLNVLILGLLTVSLLSTVLEAVRSVIVRHFSYKSELQLNFSFIRHIFSLPISFFESRKIGEILSRLGDLSQVKNALSSVALSSLIDVLLVKHGEQTILKPGLKGEARVVVGREKAYVMLLRKLDFLW